MLAWCHEHRVAVVPQGGNTGLVGGSVPLHGEVVLSLRRIDDLGPVDRRARQVTAGAGATLGALQAHVAGAGLELGVDLAARDSATVGGMVATDAGGLRVVRFGDMRHQVVGVEAVLADGSVLSRLSGLVKDNTGYDLAGLFTGSEGTLAVVTRVRLALVPRFEHRAVALLAFGSFEAALDALAVLRDRLPALDALEILFADGLELVRHHLGVAPPLPGEHAVYLLAECADHRDPTGEMAGALAGLEDLDDAVMATEPGPRAALWRLREAHTEVVATLGVPHKLDVALPASRLAEFEGRVRRAVDDAVPGARCVLFGHVGDGNLHVNVVGAAPDDRRVDRAVLTLVAELGGSISAEHGIGTAKRDLLHLGRSPEEIAAFRAVKSALDPRGILNPHVLLPPT
ncbi:MAG: FAD-binding oxidoreductase [Acidimicrobiia bacterium]|nr:FAD-binding oxidoreductase [Acidimicrobiia bacterium]